MYSKTQLASRWFRYLFNAQSGRGHGIHSPFVYELVREVLNDDRTYYAYKLIEAVKKNLLGDQRIIGHHEDLGAGSAGRKNAKKTVSAIARTAVSDEKFGRLLFRLANFYKARDILELGTSLGISTSYLASANEKSTVVSIEGSKAIAAIAAENFEKLKIRNITQVISPFDESLPHLLSTHSFFDLIFIDGNHKKEAVIRYFDQFISKVSTTACIVIHDIHWSREMEEAWEYIQQHPMVFTSIDIFSAGLVFFRSEFLVKQHFIIRF